MSLWTKRHDAYRFLAITLEDCPPLGSGSLMLGPRLNLIIGRCGTGKTSLMEALKIDSWPFGGRVSVQGEGDRSLVTRFRDFLELCPWRALGHDRPGGHWSYQAFGNIDIERQMTANLEELIRPKVGAELTKFAGIPNCGDGTFAIKVHSDGNVSVHPGSALRGKPHTSPYGSVEQLFLAYGEKYLLQLSGLLALRSFVGMDLPLLMDDGLSGLDTILAASVIRFLAARDLQVILTAGTDTWREMESFGVSANVLRV